MKPPKDSRLYLIQIRDHCVRVMNYTCGLGAHWLDTPVIVDAVCRNLEIVGEASTKLDSAFREAHPEVPWRDIIDTRNFLIHAYANVRPVVLLEIVDRDIPILLAAVQGFLDETAPTPATLQSPVPDPK